MHKRSFIVVIAAVAAMASVAGLASYLASRAPKTAPLTPYFSHDDAELAVMRGLRSESRIDAAQTYENETRAFEAVSAEKVSETSAAKLYASLAVAERDFAALSWRLSGAYSGDLSAVGRAIICAQVEKACGNIPDPGDAYAKALAKIVADKVAARNAADASAAKFPVKEGARYWKGKVPYGNLDTGNWKTWLIASPSAFRLPEPPAVGSEEMAAQLKAVHDAAEHLDAEKRAAIAYWSGNAGTKTVAGLWIEAGSDVTRTMDLPIERLLLARSVVAMAVADATVAAYDTKFTYWSPRPPNIDPGLVTVMPTPNSPGYPSTAAAIAGAASEALVLEFPDRADAWKTRAEESKNSRLWGGIHFPMDNDQGFALGRRIGAEAARHASAP